MTKILYRAKSITLLYFAIAALLISCKKDADTKDSGEVKLESFGPTGAKHGENISFIGKNLDKVTSVELPGVSVPASSFSEHTYEKIVFIIPAAAEEGFVKLKTPTGEIVSKTKINFNVPVKITSMTAKARPGENITITGEYLNWVKVVTFPSDISETTFVSRTLNELVIKVPENAKTGTLFLSSGGTEPETIETDSTLIVTLPLITAMSPNAVKHQTSLTITGTDLDLAKSVLFSGQASPVSVFESQTPTQIVVKVPAGASKGKVTLVAHSDEKTTSADDLVLLLPAITSLSPNPIEQEGNLTITGANLDLATGVSFTGITAPVTSFVSQAPTKIVVKVPVGALKGKIILSVLNSNLTVESADVLDFIGGLPPLADFAYAIYTDDLQNGFQNWSWAGNDFASTANVRQGDRSIKATYGSGGYEGITFHNDNGPSTATYTKFEFSVFGEAGTEGKNLNIVINGNWGSPYVVTITGGEWTTYSIPISSLSSPDPLKEIVLQAAGFSGVLHIDHVGLR